MDISIFGLGYVGCISMACMAANGHRIVGVDIQESKVAAINKGISPIIEAGVDKLIDKYVNGGRIRAITNGAEAVAETVASFVCVGTPPGPNGHTDTTSLLKVAKDISLGLQKKQGFHLIIIRSTVPPGTHEYLIELFAERSGKTPNIDFAVVSNPEFLREGTAVKDYYEPPFTLVASHSTRAIELMAVVYEDVKAPFYSVDIGVAELIKYVNNTFHALKISFANEIGNLCKELHIDSHALMDTFCLDKKLNISSYYLKPGFSYGGSCLPKDLLGLKTLARDLYVDCPLIETIARSNELQKSIALEKILSFNKHRIGFLGLSFKAGTDDLRNSPIVDVIETLIGKGFAVTIFDRNVKISQLVGANREYIIQRIPMISKSITDDSNKFIEDSELVVVVNSDSEYAGILEQLGGEIPIYDLVNLAFQDRSDRKNYVGHAW